jgi:hypothetical protein
MNWRGSPGFIEGHGIDSWFLSATRRKQVSGSYRGLDKGIAALYTLITLLL